MSLPLTYRVVIGYRPYDDCKGTTHYLPIHAEIPIGGTHVLESVTNTWEDSDGVEYSSDVALDSMTADEYEDGDGNTFVYVLREYYQTCIDGRQRIAYSLATLDEKDRADQVPQDQTWWVSVHHSVNREPSEESILRAIHESITKRDS